MISSRSCSPAKGSCQGQAATGVCLSGDQLLCRQVRWLQGKKLRLLRPCWNPSLGKPQRPRSKLELGSARLRRQGRPFSLCSALSKMRWLLEESAACLSMVFLAPPAW